ncbi:hypothetical protein A2276_02705 [candidate division WOR-1 bacterium RIFOXYA12_FULL_43_27]|uniref:Uncharacterized protein n=1 Tax=candidate division WOR-1 bacterium RIFOXYC2_FULL_46_14 TaxID=1802587 RepID=A0A1F4U7N6_UNCSA|nr:MAG: hypothetical protein A2276_02705 [candidate division WOR-1 bacterium RIFOXYA12_FULL_43_27]OGC19379.1 MAG: hypothetical protein A2292_01625 [candidate division WOR-1 bacterium RIFOXYB2_FULL_46_45]OGC30368.1 MAG: hypothetical protein A2232_01625 [candidate division WOR-1 bacterium RIFOXYA2_FULL_46_56]OGC40968.1 MAG: hypothetical protein A2438_01625 [candidate division WOR-1 bacterium RIFOXYC2_FULL_46_14]
MDSDILKNKEKPQSIWWREFFKEGRKDLIILIIGTILGTILSIFTEVGLKKYDDDRAKEKIAKILCLDLISTENKLLNHIYLSEASYPTYSMEQLADLKWYSTEYSTKVFDVLLEDLYFFPDGQTNKVLNIYETIDQLNKTQSLIKNHPKMKRGTKAFLLKNLYNNIHSSINFCDEVVENIERNNKELNREKSFIRIKDVNQELKKSIFSMKPSLKELIKN